MSRETATPTEERTGTVLETWQAGTVGGIVGAIAFGAMMAMQTPGVLENAIPAMYGLEGGLAGMIIHVSHGVVLGVVFAALLTVPGRTDLGLLPGARSGSSTAWWCGRFSPSS